MPYFSGSLEFESEYQTAAGETLYYAVKPKSWPYVQGRNYKLYDKNKKLNELYLGDKNELYTFPQGQSKLLADTARRRPAGAALKCLPTTATILGYRCHVLQLTQDRVSTLVFYSPELRIDLAGLSKCPSWGWYALLQATDGTLPLRTILVDAEHDITATREAIAVRPMLLIPTDFTTVAPAR
ncbi:hypothetical protein A0257_05465 [Hymenobacter psoromatis]|nr:hypothetical protein A0257_05465 [Hymenobacter psoromatis]